MKMKEYGIKDEQSDIRAHVSLPGRRVTVYRTADMVSLVSKRSYRERTARQPGVDFPTARGFLVPIEDVQPSCVLVSKAYRWDRWDHDSMNLGQRGDMAVDCVRAAIIANKFPLWVCHRVEQDVELDIRGTDIFVSAKRRIQVKYDAPAYPKNEGGTGNLFVQTHECNPLKLYCSSSTTELISDK